MKHSSLADAVRDCTLVLGTGTLTHRKPEQPVVRLDELAPLVVDAGPRKRRHKSPLVFGPEKHGLTRDDLSWCHVLVEIPTDRAQPSMNLGQAAAVCLYELATRAGSAIAESKIAEGRIAPTPQPSLSKALRSCSHLRPSRHPRRSDRRGYGRRKLLPKITCRKPTATICA